MKTKNMLFPDPQIAWQRHLPEFRAFALHLTHDEDRAGDLLQETVYLVLKNWRSFQQGSSFTAWAKTILRNVFINGYRRQRRRGDLLDRDRPQHAWLTDTTTANAAEGGFSTTEILRLIEELPEANRRAFRLHLRGYRYHEIARLTDSPIGTAKSRVHGARKVLRRQLAYLRTA